MNEVFKILRQIEATSSRNEKKEILLNNKHNETFRKFLKYAYNPRWMYGIGTKSIKLKNKNETCHNTTPQVKRSVIQNPLFNAITHMDIFTLCDILKMHPFGSNEDVTLVNNFLGDCNDEEKYWYTRLLLKDLKIGCTAKTINEVFIDFIPIFNVMLAYPYKKYADKIKGAFQIQEKLDGFRFIVFHQYDGSLKFFTRNGVELFNFPEIEKAFKDVTKYPSGMVYDGELQANRSFNDTQKLVMKNGNKTGLVYNVFDCLTIDEFEKEVSFDNLFHRYEFLKIAFMCVKSDYIKVVPELYRGTDISKITEYFELAKSKGWEGIMCKLNAPYVRTRTSNMLKVKEFDTIDLQVIRVNEGTGRNKGFLGSVTVLYKDTEVEVGSGFDDYLRKSLWENPNLIIDKTIEIQFFEETINESGKPSLRFPIFKCIRNDK